MRCDMRNNLTHTQTHTHCIQCPDSRWDQLAIQWRHQLIKLTLSSECWRHYTWLCCRYFPKCFENSRAAPSFHIWLLMFWGLKGTQKADVPTECLLIPLEQVKVTYTHTGTLENFITCNLTHSALRRYHTVHTPPSANEYAFW